MTGYMTCTSKDDIKSYGTMAFGWLDGTTDRTVAAWINQDRTNEGDNPNANEIYISVGYVDDDTLSIANDIGIRSSSPPAIACFENFSSSYDCILAYVDISDMTNVIKTTRFTVTESTNNYVVNLDTSGPYTVNTNATTASPMALWYISTTNTFYLAFRSSGVNQNIVVYESNTSGTDWSLETSNLDYSITGPSAASVFRGVNNQLVYVKE